MNAEKATHQPLISRKEKFMFKDASEGQVRFEIDSFEAAIELGSKTGKLILQSFKEGHRIDGLYLYGCMHEMQKRFIQGLTGEFEHSEDVVANEDSIKSENDFSWPVVCIADAFGPFSILEREICPDSPEKIVVLAHSELVEESKFAASRIEVELFQGRNADAVWKSTQAGGLIAKPGTPFATFVGTGFGIEVIESLKS